MSRHLTNVKRLANLTFWGRMFQGEAKARTKALEKARGKGNRRRGSTGRIVGAFSSFIQNLAFTLSKIGFHDSVENKSEAV